MTGTGRIALVPLNGERTEEFVSMNQRSFQVAFDDEFGKGAGTAIPREDILSSLGSPVAESFAVMMDGTMVGGVCIQNNPKSLKGSLDLLFVDIPYQGKGIGYEVWNLIEGKYPDVRIWETHTPYFDKRNIHFYVNKCGFSIVEFYCPQHTDQSSRGAPGGELFFRFEKRMF